MSLSFLRRLGGRDDEWRAHFRKELDKLEQELPSGTDSWHPHRPAHEFVDKANKVVASIKRHDLPNPYVLAGSDGSLQLKWRKSDKELSFFISDEGLSYLAVESNIPKDGFLEHPEQANEFVEWLLR